MAGIIVKKIKSEKGKRSARATIAYILDLENLGDKDDKILFHGSLNLFANDTESQIQEIEERQKSYIGQAKLLNDHHIISYGKNDLNLSKEQYFSDAYKLLENLGKQDHAAVFAVHKNTEHLHVHIYIDNISPLTGETAPENAGLVSLKDKNGRHKTHFAFCHQATGYAIAEKYGLNTEHYQRTATGARNPNYKPPKILHKNPHEVGKRGNSRQVTLLQGAEIIIKNAKSFEDMKKELKKFGIKYELKYNKNGQLKGAIFKQGKTCAAVSKIIKGGHFGLVKKFDSLPPPPPPKPKKTINDVLYGILENSRHEEGLRQELLKNGYILSKSGNNFTILNEKGENIKPSSLHRNFSTQNLRKKWRKLEKSTTPPPVSEKTRQANIEEDSQIEAYILKLAREKAKNKHVIKDSAYYLKKYNTMMEEAKIERENNILPSQIEQENFETEQEILKQQEKFSEQQTAKDNTPPDKKLKPQQANNFKPRLEEVHIPPTLTM